MPSNRLPPHGQINALSQAMARMLEHGTAFADLTETNPTRVGLPYPSDLLRGLADAKALSYEPHPLGLASARAAVAADQQRRGADIEPAQVVLTASTSEAYTWLFKLLCDPGESVLVPRPSYPLFEHLTTLEGVRAVPYELEFHGRWAIDLDSVRAAPADTRALLVVSPNNPTGSFISRGELGALDRLCAERGWALVADEVFADFPLEADAPVTDLAARAGALTFTLGGLSKALGLPQLKLGWIIAGGDATRREPALAALEIIADTFLSVGTPVQQALPSLLQDGKVVRDAIRARIQRNLTGLRRIAASHPACDVLPVEGGWSAVIRVPATRGEEQLVLDLLQSERVLVHPGYFFDFRHEAFIVVSLLPREDIFADAAERALRFASR